MLGNAFTLTSTIVTVFLCADTQSNPLFCVQVADHKGSVFCLVNRRCLLRQQAYQSLCRTLGGDQSTWYKDEGCMEAGLQNGVTIFVIALATPRGASTAVS